VLEVNAQCGLSEDENYTSIGAILRLSGNSYKDLVIDIINDAFIKYGENGIESLCATADYSTTSVDYKYYDPAGICLLFFLMQLLITFY
jgi:hypothetical protein